MFSFSHSSHFVYFGGRAAPIDLGFAGTVLDGIHCTPFRYRLQEALGLVCNIFTPAWHCITKKRRMQVHSGETGVDGGGRGWYNEGDNQQMRRVLTMNEKKQSGYPQEDPNKTVQ